MNTNASHPNTAVRRCAALQRAARAVNVAGVLTLVAAAARSLVDARSSAPVDGLRMRAASPACAVAQPRASSSPSGASARPIAVAAKASPRLSTVNRPRLVTPYLAWASESAQYQIGIDTYARTTPAAVIAASPSAKPAIEVSPSQARSLHVCGSELTVFRSGKNPPAAGRR